MKIIFIIVLIVLALLFAVLYSAVVVGADADYRAELEWNDYLRRRDKLLNNNKNELNIEELKDNGKQNCDV